MHKVIILHLYDIWSLHQTVCYFAPQGYCSSTSAFASPNNHNQNLENIINNKI